MSKSFQISLSFQVRSSSNKVQKGLFQGDDGALLEREKSNEMDISRRMYGMVLEGVVTEASIIRTVVIFDAVIFVAEVSDS